MGVSLIRKLGAVRNRLRLDPLSLRRLWNTRAILRAARLLSGEPKSVLFVTSLLRAREMKLSAALRGIGWKVVLVYIETTPFKPGKYFDEAIQARSEVEAHIYARLLGPRVCQVFSGAVDGMIYRFCADKPGPVVIDMNDVFCESLFDYCHERFEPTRECLERADGLCARDLQAKSAEKLEGFRLPGHNIWFPEYSWLDGPKLPGAIAKGARGEVHVVSVGTFCLESLGMYDSAYLRLAEMLTGQRIHFHIYPHWFYRHSRGSVFNHDLEEEFVDFFRLAKRSPYLHIHDSLPLDELARVLPQYDFGIVAGGCEALGQKLKMLKPEYMRICYSGRISDYLDARLPVLINREVGFNYWLLKRHGLMVDLAHILEPGFREYLLEIKSNRAVAENVERAAHKLSLAENVGRLGKFYETLIADTASEWTRLPYPFSLFTSLPWLGKVFRKIESELRRVSQQASGLRVALEGERKQAGRRLAAQQRLLRRQKSMIDKLKEHLDQVASGLGGALLSAGAELPDDGSSAMMAHVGQESARRPRNILKAKQSLEVERGPNWADELIGLLNWTEIKDPGERTTGMPELMEMIALFGAGDGAISEPSAAWQVLGFKNFNQLLRDGYSNFKRTIGCSYFNFLVQAGDPQIGFLEADLDAATRKQCEDAAASMPEDKSFNWHDQRAYRYFVLMLWAYTRKVDTHGYLDRLEEPAEGNPLIVPIGKTRGSQDLANSVLEYYSISKGVDFANCKRVLEIGGGYGRDAFVVLQLNPHIQYTLVDIPPALWVAQRYLSSVFPARKVFHVRDFGSYAEVAAEMEDASIVFLLPHQLAMLPDCRFDLSLNISSFGEMQQQQINTYFQALTRVTRGYFYMKQWKISQNAFDHLALTADDYPISKDWKKLYSRECAVQTAFFETLYRTE